MIDRSVQKDLLERLAKCYPDACCDLFPEDDPEENLKIANLLYLEEHELVISGVTQYMSGEYGTTSSKITAKGLDFLADDGGLTAILGTVTVKLHADTIRDLLEAKIDSSSLPVEEKSKLKKHLSTISSETLKILTKRLVEKGIDSLPNIANWLQTVFPLH